MNGYLVFKFEKYYPDGGWDDFHAAYGSKEEAVKMAMELVRSRKVDYAQVVDLSTMRKIGEACLRMSGTEWRPA